MKRVRLAGVNHRRAPVEIRERLAVPSARIPEVLAAFRRSSGAAEALILSTCNRLEIYSVAGAGGDAADSARAFFAERGCAPAAVDGLLDVMEGIEAIRHL